MKVKKAQLINWTLGSLRHQMSSASVSGAAQFVEWKVRLSPPSLTAASSRAVTNNRFILPPDQDEGCMTGRNDPLVRRCIHALLLHISSSQRIILQVFLKHGAGR